MERSSQAARRKASWARASRDEAGLPSPRQSTEGGASEGKDASWRDSRSVSGEADGCERGDRDVREVRTDE